MLSKTERKYLMGRLKVSGSYRRKILHKIRRRLAVAMEDLALCISKGLLDEQALLNLVTPVTVSGNGLGDMLWSLQRNEMMVPRAGFEPATLRSSAGCSP